MGVNGKVGQAAAQIASWRGARVIGVVRKPEAYAGHCSTPVDVIDSSAAATSPPQCGTLTGGQGADIVYNTVGDPYYPAAEAAMAKGGRQILIALDQRPAGIRHLRLLPRPPHLCRHRYAGLLLGRDGCRAAVAAAGVRGRRIAALPIGAGSRL